MHLPRARRYFSAFLPPRASAPLPPSVLRLHAVLRCCLAATVARQRPRGDGRRLAFVVIGRPRGERFIGDLLVKQLATDRRQPRNHGVADSRYSPVSDSRYLIANTTAKPDASRYRSSTLFSLIDYTLPDYRKTKQSRGYIVHLHFTIRAMRFTVSFLLLANCFAAGQTFSLSPINTNTNTNIRTSGAASAAAFRRDTNTQQTILVRAVRAEVWPSRSAGASPPPCGPTRLARRRIPVALLRLRCHRRHHHHRQP